MKPMTVTSLRNDLYNTIDRVIETGVPVVVERKGKKVKIVAAQPGEKVDIFKKLSKLKPHNNAIVGDPEELVDLKVWEWHEEKNL